MSVDDHATAGSPDSRDVTPAPAQVVDVGAEDIAAAADVPADVHVAAAPEPSDAADTTTDDAESTGPVATEATSESGETEASDPRDGKSPATSEARVGVRAEEALEEGVAAKVFDAVEDLALAQVLSGRASVDEPGPGARLEIRVPDDWHLHVRDGDVLSAVIPHTARHFARAIIMPNLVPPVVTRAQALAYRNRVRAAVPEGMSFEPLPTVYLTETTDPDDVSRGYLAGDIVAAKLYPASATTNSDSGVRDMAKIDAVLARMAEIGMPMLVHGEVTDPGIDIFDREAVFLDRVLDPMRQRHPDLKVVLEHVTTRQGVEYVLAARDGIAATITVHHLMINRNAIFKGGVRPHYYCLPLPKREKHRLALLDAATSGDRRFFLGTDSAPHLVPDKESACGCAGLFTAPVALSCLAQVFEDMGALDKLEGFASLNGPAFYGLPVNERRCTLVRSREPEDLMDQVMVGRNAIVVFDPERPVHWSVEPSAVADFDRICKRKSVS